MKLNTCLSSRNDKQIAMIGMPIGSKTQTGPGIVPYKAQTHWSKRPWPVPSEATTKSLPADLICCIPQQQFRREADSATALTTQVTDWAIQSRQSPTSLLSSLFTERDDVGYSVVRSVFFRRKFRIINNALASRPERKNMPDTANAEGICTGFNQNKKHPNYDYGKMFLI